MGRKCTVCTHPKVDEIDLCLIAGEPFRKLSDRYGLSTTALFRHKSDHLPIKLTKAAEVQVKYKADDSLAQLHDILERVLGIFEKNESRGRDAIALQAAREIRSYVELSAKLVGQLQEQPTINITLSPRWINLRTVILQSLDPYPEAKEAVLLSITEAEDDIGD